MSTSQYRCNSCGLVFDKATELEAHNESGVHREEGAKNVAKIPE